MPSLIDPLTWMHPAIGVRYSKSNFVESCTGIWANRVLSVSEERRPLSRRNNFRSLSAISLRVVGWSLGRPLRYSPLHLSGYPLYIPPSPSLSFQFPLPLQIQWKGEGKFVVATSDLDVTTLQGEKRAFLMLSYDKYAYSRSNIGKPIMFMCK